MAPTTRRSSRARTATVGLGTAYALGLLVYGAARPWMADPSGLLELANNFAPWWYLPVLAVVLAGAGLHSRLLTLTGLASVAAFAATWGHLFVPPAPRPSESGQGFTVMTLNVLADNHDHTRLAGAIAREDPDLVALQELEPDAAPDLVRAIGQEYPYRAFQTATKRGAGVLSRLPLRDTESFQLSEGGNWAQRLRVDTPGGTLTLFNVHPPIPRLVWSESLGPLRIPIGYETDRRSAEVQSLLSMLATTSGPVLVAGDFNMSEYSADYRLMRARLGDAYRAAGSGFGHTFPRFGSFPRSLPAPWPVLRLDYVWHSVELRPCAARVGPAGGSDHHPVIVRFTWAERASDEVGC